MKKMGVTCFWTGGTVASEMSQSGGGRSYAASGPRQVILNSLRQVPYATFKPAQTLMHGDGSDHPRAHVLDLGRSAMRYVSSVDGILAFCGTDSMNVNANILALIGNEVLTIPLVLCGSIKASDKEGSGASVNTFTGGYFSAYGGRSGIFQVRPNGRVITSRIDTPDGSFDWHSRDYGKDFHRLSSLYFSRGDMEDDLAERRNHSFARVQLEKLIGRDGELRESVLNGGGSFSRFINTEKI